MSDEPEVTHRTATAGAARDAASRRSTTAQWFGILAGPLATLADQQLQYALVPWACYSGLHAALHVPPILFLAVTIAGGLVARHEWRTAGRGEPDAEGGVVARTRFLGVLGMATSVYFALVILAMWLGNAFLDTCDGIGS